MQKRWIPAQCCHDFGTLFHEPIHWGALNADFYLLSLIEWLLALLLFLKVLQPGLQCSLSLPWPFHDIFSGTPCSLCSWFSRPLWVLHDKQYGQPLNMKARIALIACLNHSQSLSLHKDSRGRYESGYTVQARHAELLSAGWARQAWCIQIIQNKKKYRQQYLSIDHNMMHYIMHSKPVMTKTWHLGLRMAVTHWWE